MALPCSCIAANSCVSALVCRAVGRWLFFRASKGRAIFESRRRGPVCGTQSCSAVCATGRSACRPQRARLAGAHLGRPAPKVLCVSSFASAPLRRTGATIKKPRRPRKQSLPIELQRDERPRDQVQPREDDRRWAWGSRQKESGLHSFFSGQVGAYLPNQTGWKSGSRGITQLRGDGGRKSRGRLLELKHR